ncbi:MAG: sugar ABC transporter permease [Anaerolineae bacterium]|nr:sugar ABC transporter permease [Anaerolineae bacterium]MCA9892672.1 sugar ABC transporter permease [Anaerolineae bacterium]
MRSQRTGWMLLAPSIIILFIFGFIPFIYVLVVGFNEWNIFAATEGLRFSGLDNYRRLVFDADFLDSVRLTAIFTFFAILSEVVLGFLLANLLTRDFPGKSIFRVVHTFPLMIAPIAVGAIWRLLVIPGLGPVPFFMDRWLDFNYNIGADPSQALLTTILMDVWHWTPFVTLTLLAGLTAIPKEPVEQARVDGANRFQVFWHVTLPYLRPVLLTTIFIRIMDAIRTVDEVWMLAGGGPGTRFTGIYIWRVVFPRTDYGYGSSISIVTLYITIVLCWLLFIGISGKRKDYVE